MAALAARIRKAAPAMRPATERSPPSRRKPRRRAASARHLRRRASLSPVVSATAMSCRVLAGTGRPNPAVTQAELGEQGVRGVGRRPARNFCAALVPDRGATLTVAGASPQERAIGNMRSARPRGGASSPTRKKADPGRTTMKLLISAAAALALAGAASAQTLDDLKNDGKNTDNILTYGMGYSQNRFSPLSQI